MAKIKKFYFKINLNMLLFVFGIVLGTVGINCYYGYYGDTSLELLNTYFNSVSTPGLFGEVFFGLLIRRLLLAVLILVIFEIFNNISTVYIMLATLGVFSGIILTILSMNLGIKSIGVFIMICFPHIFIYLLSAFIVIRIKFSGYYIAGLNDSYKSSFFINNINKRKGYLLTIIILIIGILFETLNALYILPKVFSTVV